LKKEISVVGVVEHEKREPTEMEKTEKGRNDGGFRIRGGVNYGGACGRSILYLFSFFSGLL
jgi:hypothetical protein